jgi:hypothetical protein
MTQYTAHNLANNFLSKDQKDLNPRTLALDPPSAEVSIILEGSSITSKES